MELKDKRDEVELMTFNLNYERWYDLYFPKNAAAIADEMSDIAGGFIDDDMELPVTDIDELDQFYESRENTRWMSALDIPMDDFSGGRRV